MRSRLLGFNYSSRRVMPSQGQHADRFNLLHPPKFHPSHELPAELSRPKPATQLQCRNTVQAQVVKATKRLMFQPETCRDACLLVVEVAEALCFLTELFLVPAKDLLAAAGSLPGGIASEATATTGPRQGLACSRLGSYRGWCSESFWCCGCSHLGPSGLTGPRALGS